MLIMTRVSNFTIFAGIIGATSLFLFGAQPLEKLHNFAISRLYAVAQGEVGS